jgi:hypothetical protein
MPIPNDPDWTIFEQLPEDVPIIVCDDSNGQLSPPPRRNVRVFDYAAQALIMGDHHAAIPHKCSACRNFGHYLAYSEGYDVIIALDYDCRTRLRWLEQHLEALGDIVDAPALRGRWLNTIEQPGVYARGFPYEYRNQETAACVSEMTATGEVKLNMGVWDNVLDLNGIDKLKREPPPEPGLRGERNYVALGMIPLCGMNTAFRAELTPAYFFLPDVWIEGWQLSRHDDIWGGYVLERLMQKRGDLTRFGRPVVEHTRQTNLQRVVVLEHYMHLLSGEFYALVDAAIEEVRPASYVDMFAQFTDEFRRGVERSRAPAHYRQAYRDVGEAMQRWSDAFRAVYLVKGA